MSERLKSLWIAEFETADFNTSLNESQQIKYETIYKSQHTLSAM